jgi:hypothetical protein
LVTAVEVAVVEVAVVVVVVVAVAVLVRAGAGVELSHAAASRSTAAPSAVTGMRTLLTPFRHADITSRLVQVGACYLDFAE